MRRGFTLIEVIISVALVAILILTVSSMNLFSVRTNRSTRGRDGAFNLARGLCELYKVQELEDSLYNHGAVFKYLSSIEDIENINDIFEDSEGIYTGQELIVPSRSEGYVAVLEAVRVYAPPASSYPVPEVISLRVTVRENRTRGTIVSLTSVR